jgi:8-hydroxy-5-deazaflavin:NADPH oxidoreductase
VSELGPRARAGTTGEAAAAGDLVVVAIPLRAIGDVPAEALVGKTVIDTNNYYPRRDGNIAALDDDSLTSSELLQSRLPGAHVVKAFNHIHAREITTDGNAAGYAEQTSARDRWRRCTREGQVAKLIDGFGFDATDVGPLAES